MDEEGGRYIKTIWRWSAVVVQTSVCPNESNERAGIEGFRFNDDLNTTPVPPPLLCSRHFPRYEYPMGVSSSMTAVFLCLGFFLPPQHPRQVARIAFKPIWRTCMFFITIGSKYGFPKSLYESLILINWLMLYWYMLPASKVYWGTCREDEFSWVHFKSITIVISWMPTSWSVHQAEWQ